MDQQNFGNSNGYQVSANRIEHLGDRYNHYGPQEITESGVGDSPPNFQDYWVERRVYQDALSDRLDHHPVTEIVAEGGFGKSALAAWAHHHLRERFQKRIWVSFRQAKRFDRVARWILQEIGFPNKDPRADDATLLRELCYRLNDPNRPVRTLVVLDQLETMVEGEDGGWFERFLGEWAAAGRLSRVLVTTRVAVVSQEPPM
ncbi:MAG: hypothetical protein HC824_13390, partial [Synechococcales cyanobacterium RM1_1_8]|nr:hypothetical protein [Synechococcales cyanobacterium RM1_1_8]